MKQKAIVIGAGIIGLAVARALHIKGFDVTIIEQNEKAVGASIRNFGMIWPIGQPDGKLYNRAIKTKAIWKHIAHNTGMWHNECGSLHVAYNNYEWVVLQELYHAFTDVGRPVSLLTPEDIHKRFQGIQNNYLLGGLFCSDEMIINPVEAIPTLASYLQQDCDVTFHWGKKVTAIDANKVYIGNTVLQSDIIFVCSGADFQTLYPELFAAQAITKCKLQMMRFTHLQHNWQINTSVCGGLSLTHYPSFKVAKSLYMLKKHYEDTMPEYIVNGIHVMVSQNNYCELTVGDSHEYALTFDPFDKANINKLIMDYLQQFMHCQQWTMQQSWHGIYPKMTNNATELFLHPSSQVYILNGIGGVGMTLGLGLAEEIVATL